VVGHDWKLSDGRVWQSDITEQRTCAHCGEHIPAIVWPGPADRVEGQMDDRTDEVERARAKMAQGVGTLLKNSQDNWPILLDLFAHTAKERKAKFDAYYKAGFTEAQALYLCQQV
jgi:hypothetical protein